jgi:hypothetical protein
MYTLYQVSVVLFFHISILYIKLFSTYKVLMLSQTSVKTLDELVTILLM